MTKGVQFEAVPLQFIVSNQVSGSKDKKQARTVAAHVSGKFKLWQKQRSSRSLDSSTLSILDHNRARRPTTSWERVGKRPRSVRQDAETSKLLPSYPRIPIHANIGSSQLDPFTRWSQPINADEEYLTKLYFKLIAPFAMDLMGSWEWFDNLSQVQATPVLQYAICAFSSVFRSGCIGSGKLVTLPPPPSEGNNVNLWDVPPWLAYHSKCVAELKAIVASGDPSQAIIAYEAILLLLRICILLCDGDTARIHLKALCSLGTRTGRSIVALKAELAMMPDNIVAAFVEDGVDLVENTNRFNGDLTPAQVVVVRKPRFLSDHQRHTRETLITGRYVVWDEGPPSNVILPSTATALRRMDIGLDCLEWSLITELCRCYQLMLFLICFINGISFDSSHSRVRSTLLELHSRMLRMDTTYLYATVPCTLFNLALVGALASRGQPERAWCVQCIGDQFVEIQSVNDMKAWMRPFVEPSIVLGGVIDEVWSDVLIYRDRRLTVVPATNEASE
jgi:hypothetical protein